MRTYVDELVTYIEKEVTYVAACHHCDWYFLSNDKELVESKCQQHESIDHYGGQDD